MKPHCCRTCRISTDVHGKDVSLLPKIPIYASTVTYMQVTCAMGSDAQMLVFALFANNSRVFFIFGTEDQMSVFP